MKKRSSEEIELESKLKGVMEFYVTTYFDHYSPKIKEEVARVNAYIEIGIMEKRIDDRLRELVDEAAKKFHDVALLILDIIATGRENKVREFEILFVDLVKRTLVKDMEKEKAISPIVIIADPEVNPKEN
jgi:hypothetical protein